MPSSDGVDRWAGLPAGAGPEGGPLVAEPTNEIRTRTPGEREAFLVGYAAAINDIHDQGFVWAQEWLRTMWDVLRSLTRE